MERVERIVREGFRRQREIRITQFHASHDQQDHGNRAGRRALPAGWTDEGDRVVSPEFGSIDRADWDNGKFKRPPSEGTGFYKTPDGRTVRFNDYGSGDVEAVWVHSEEFWLNQHTKDAFVGGLQFWGRGSKKGEVLQVGVKKRSPSYF